MIDVNKFVDGLHDYLKTQFSPLIDRIKKLEELKPVPGPKGEKGDSVDKDEIIAELSKSLPKGEKGDPGESVSRDEIKQMIDEAVAKLPKAQDGKDGSDGKDALQIEILPYDETKSYKRGEYVYHRGGVLRAYQKTDGLKGFDVLINGIADSYYGAQEDGRTFVFTTELTDGTVIENKTVLPVILYKGIFDKTSEYQKGDVVTYDGSAWVCEGEVKGAPGTKDSGFKMMVKSGRDKHVVRLKEE